MSAITGIWHLDDAPAADQHLAPALTALERYGLERGDVWTDGPRALGCRLRRFLPEDQFDAQPLVSADHRFHLVADVRLDNRDELAADLGIRTRELQSLADSALLMAAWGRWNSRCLERLAGDFAFAVWDRHERRLFLARDHTGARPLFYYHRPGRLFAFASMPKGLQALPEVATELDEELIVCYLALIPTHNGRLLFRGVERLPPAHSLVVTLDGLVASRYWHLERTPEIRFKTEPDYLDGFRELLEAAVEARLRGIGGIAAHLSAGLDSGSVMVTAARQLARAGRSLTAFTAVPGTGAAGAAPGQLGDEGPAAAEVAALHPNVEHVLLDSSRSSFLELLDPLIAASDQPPLNPVNAIWLDAIQREAAARGERVILTGGLGNLSFSQSGLGALSEWFRRGKWLRLIRAGWALHANQLASSRNLAAAAIGPSLPRWVRRHLVGQRFSLSYSLVHPEAVARLGVVERAWDALHHNGTGIDSWFRMQLSQGDDGANQLAIHASHGVDQRDPTRDRRLIAYCFGVPAEEWLRGGQTRSLVRRAMSDRLPTAALSRRNRGFQSSDWHVTMGGIRPAMLAEVEALEGSPIARRVLDLPRARRLITDWPRGEFHSGETRAAWYAALSRGLSVGRFVRRFDPEAG